MQCSYTKPVVCDGELDEPYERPKGRWWARCLKCARANRLTVSHGKDGSMFAHPSPVGPPPDDLVRWNGWIENGQSEWLENQLHPGEHVRAALRKYIDEIDNMV